MAYFTDSSNEMNDKNEWVSHASGFEMDFGPLYFLNSLVQNSDAII